MPRPGPRGDQLEPLKDLIQACIQAKETYAAIAAIVSAPPHNIKVSEQKIQKQCKQWGITRRIQRTTDADVIDLINQRFHFSFDSDKVIADRLNEAGHWVTTREVQDIRRKHGWLQRPPVGSLPGASQPQIEAVVQTKLAEGTVRQYGCRFLQSALRHDGVVASRSSVLQAQQVLDPEGVASRTKDWKGRKVGLYQTAGPNWLWSVDSHLKLHPWDIEIYACIDTFSRRVVWIFVNSSAMTQIAVVRQFLLTVNALRKFPKRIQADRGSETTMMFDAQYNLYQQWLLDSNIATVDRIDDFPLRDCALFGPSTKNVKVEGFWGQLQRHLLTAWADYFRHLQQEHWWTYATADRVVALFILLPVIQKEVFEFVKHWNLHKIRNQPDRPGIITGRPDDLYFYPPNGAPDYARKPPQSALTTLMQQTDMYDPDVFLPQPTLAWCQTMLEQIGFPGPITAGQFIRNKEQHIPWFYKQLVVKARHHSLVQRSLPREVRDISMLIPALGGYSWEPTAAVLASQAAAEANDYDEELRGMVEDFQEPGLDAQVD